MTQTNHNNGQVSNPPNIMLPVGAPFSQEAEQAVLGCVLIEPASFMSLRAFLRPDNFFLVRHQYIWQACMDLDDSKTPLDAITIADTLERKGKLDEIGGRAYLIELANNSGSSIHAEVYGRLVERAAIRRQLLQFTDELRKQVFDETTQIKEVLNHASAKLLDIGASNQEGELSSIFDVTSAHMDTIEWRIQNPNTMIGIPSGFRLIDGILRGFQKKRFYLIASRPGMGKSAIMGNMALNIAKSGKRIAWFSYEMSKHELVTRFISCLARIDNQAIESGMMSLPEQKRYNESASTLSMLPMNVTDNSFTPLMMRAACRKLKHTKGLDAIFVDYVQLIPSDELFGNRYQEVGYVSRMLKEMAMELDIPIIAAAQLSRTVENRQNKRPLLSDLRESGNLEQDADVVTFLYSDAYYDQNEQHSGDPFWIVETIIAKQRNGSTGTCKMGFNRPYTHFADFDVHNKFSEQLKA